MGSSANITSVAEIGHFRLALKSFEEEASNALTSVMLQVRRTVDWVEHDQLQHWQMRVKRGYDEVAETRTTLERCQMFALDGERRGCDEEKKAFEKAKRHLRHAQEKVEIVKKWARMLSHEVAEYQAASGRLNGWLESECPKALAALERMMTSLEAYLATEVATIESSTIATESSTITRSCESSETRSDSQNSERADEKEKGPTKAEPESFAGEGPSCE